MTNEITKTAGSNLQDYDPNTIYGFEETKSEDLIIPRIKVINALSPERIEGIAQEGDVIDSLSKESIEGKKFIPIKQYYNNIEWNPDRTDDVRILCSSLDGKIGTCEDGTRVCATCKRNKFDNTKKGKESYPKCTSYLNFLGFFDDVSMPVILSFAKTNYSEGRKMLSIAKSLRSSLWDYSYSLEGKKITKDRNTWYIIVPKLANETTEEQRALAFNVYKTYANITLKTSYDEEGSSGAKDNSIDLQTEKEIG